MAFFNRFNSIERRVVMMMLAFALAVTACGGTATEASAPAADAAPAEAPAADPTEVPELAASEVAETPTTAPVEAADPPAETDELSATETTPVRLVTGVDGNEFDLSPAGEETILWFWAPW